MFRSMHISTMSDGRYFIGVFGANGGNFHVTTRHFDEVTSMIEMLNPEHIYMKVGVF